MVIVNDIYEYGVKIFVVGDEILKHPCNEVSITDILQSDLYLHEAQETAFIALDSFRAKNGFGRAIAAPQVGFPIRMIAMNIEGIKYTLFNPVIVKKSNEMFYMWDDCLSFPNLVVCVQRHREVSIRFIDEKGNVQLWENLNLCLSELIQHEIDHLDGILAIDRAVKPIKTTGTSEFICDESIIDRTIYLSKKDYYDSVVDYFI